MQKGASILEYTSKLQLTHRLMNQNKQQKKKKIKNLDFKKEQNISIQQYNKQKET